VRTHGDTLSASITIANVQQVTLAIARYPALADRRYACTVRPFVLVRHAKPVRDSSLSSEDWNLDPNHLGAVSVLAAVLETMGLVQLVSSTERRAVQTGNELAHLVAVPMDSDARLNEVRRPSTESYGAFSEDAKSYLHGATVVGWEQQATVIERMLSAVETVLDRDVGLVGFVTHGTVMSVFLGHLGLVQPWDFWRTLTTPDGWLIDGSVVHRLCVESSF
jgi:broad specificity phosphatase PhoE